MVVEKLPEVNPPSDRVPGQGLLAAPILKRRRRRNRGEIAEKGSVLEDFGSRCKYRPKGGQGVDQGVQRPLARPRVGPHHQSTWTPGAPPLLSSFGDSERFL